MVIHTVYVTLKYIYKKDSIYIYILIYMGVYTAEIHVKLAGLSKASVCIERSSLWSHTVRDFV
jgi:hypothetical protein